MYRVLRNSNFQLLIIEELSEGRRSFYRYSTTPIKDSPSMEMVEVSEVEAMRYLVGVGRSILNKSVMDFDTMRDVLDYIEFQGCRQTA